MSELDFSNLFALVIGIDHYKQIPPLRGCINDAMSVAEYLLDTLSVPKDNVKLLFDSQATREGIIDTFRNHLTFNGKIRHSDPIVIYFSGHGDRQTTPPEWHSSDGQTELIMPFDASFNDDNNYLPEKTYKHGIPDRTLGALIHELSLQKGDNITMMLDCCHSGSATRGSKIRARYSHDRNAPAIPPNLDEAIVRSVSILPSASGQNFIVARRSFGRFQSSQSPSLETHVLLSACRNDEEALEIDSGDESGGIFTRCLLKALEDCDLATTSYSGLMRIIPKQIEVHTNGRKQTPQCEGRKQDRLLFRTQFALSRGMIQLDRDPTTESFHIKAGSASGIQEGTELSVYVGDMSDTARPLTRLVATHVTATEATLSFPSAAPLVNIPTLAYVVVTKYTGYSVRILVDEKIKLLPEWPEATHALQSQPISLVWSKPSEPADLVLALTEKGIEVQRSEPSLIQLDPNPLILAYGLSMKELVQRLGSIIHFHFHLQRQNPNSPIKGQVEMKLIELKEKPGYGWGSRAYAPASDSPVDLFGDWRSTGKTATLDSNPSKRYGLQLTNTSSWPLFAWVFYFDFENYSIESLYEPPSASVNPPLSNDRRVLPIGYGDSGAEPLRFEASTDSSRETGVFMLFVSKAWVNISQITQSSIWEAYGGQSKRTGDNPVKPESNVWDVLLVEVSIS